MIRKRMSLHGVEAQIEAVGDVLVGVAFGEELVNLLLAFRERVEAVVDLTVSRSPVALC